MKLGVVVTVLTRTKLGDANLEDLDDAIIAHGDAFVHAYGSNRLRVSVTAYGDLPSKQDETGWS